MPLLSGPEGLQALITRRGVIEDMPVENDVTCVIGKMPVAESFGFSNDIRAATQGRAVWNTENAGYDQVPQSFSTR